MYIVPLKTAITEALRNTFDIQYPSKDFSGTVNISIEYPINKQDYPGIWVQFEDTDPLEIAGIKHREIVYDEDNRPHEVTRWRFFGTLSFTCVAMTSLERDRLFDELVRIFAFSQVDYSAVTEFRDTIENNDLIACSINYDVLRPSGDSAGRGTPWNTEDEVIYEKTLSVDIIGEFVSNPNTNALEILSKIEVEGYLTGTPSPRVPGSPDDGEPHTDWDPQFH